MGKVFLSHSSKDKEFVKIVADLLGKNKSIYDEYYFEKGEKTLKQIFEALDSTDIFVYFISENSLNADWVKLEINRAKELLDYQKIKRIFPIIIDENITHSDPRIANFLKDGFESYNIQRVISPQIAYRKILQQLSKIELDNDSEFFERKDYFYGRDNEIKRFKSYYDDPTNSFEVKAMIVSGISGIGRKEYIKKSLTEAKIIPSYYSPIIISLSKYSNIEDLIIHLSNVGFGSYTISSISDIKTMEEKINILTDLINIIQKYREIVIIEDDECIINASGDISYWFYNALNKSEKGFSIAIVSNINIEKFQQKKYPEIFFENLLELEASDIIGVIRTYSKKVGVDISKEDAIFLLGSLSGYPPQIIFCVDKIEEYGIDYVKNHTYEIASMPERTSAKILDSISEQYESKEFYGLLALIAKIELVPMSLINKIFKSNKIYQSIFIDLKKFSICYFVGATREYIKINSFIQSYISRNKFSIPKDISDILNNEINQFNNTLKSDFDENMVDISEFKFFLKSNLSNGIEAASNFMYSTIIVQTIIELYHNMKYNKVIDITKDIKSNDRYNYFDDSVKNTIQRYYCQSLIKNHDPDFDVEVEYFFDKKLWNDYDFLKGFNFRNRGAYEKARDKFLKVLERIKNHYAAKRELVNAYISLQDYDSALLYAESNYKHNRDNIFSLQTYFECLLEQKKLDERQEKDLSEMKQSLINAQRIKPSSLYYQLMAQYKALKENNYPEAIKILDKGLKIYEEDMYLLRVKFDIYRRKNDISKMESTLKELNTATAELEYRGVFFTRQAILDLMKGKSKDSVRNYLSLNGDYSNEYIENLIKKYSK